MHNNDNIQQKLLGTKLIKHCDVSQKLNWDILIHKMLKSLEGLNCEINSIL